VVAFFTLIERKIIGLSHFRLGPNKIGPIGLLQPFNDALKLLSKEVQKLKKTNMFLFILAPGLVLFIYTVIWVITPLIFSQINNKVVTLTLFTIISISVYFFIVSG